MTFLVWEFRPFFPPRRVMCFPHLRRRRRPPRLSLFCSSSFCLSFILVSSLLALRWLRINGPSRRRGQNVPKIRDTPNDPKEWVSWHVNLIHSHTFGLGKVTLKWNDSICVHNHNSKYFNSSSKYLKILDSCDSRLKARGCEVRSWRKSGHRQQASVGERVSFVCQAHTFP